MTIHERNCAQACCLARLGKKPRLLLCANDYRGALQHNGWYRPSPNFSNLPKDYRGGSTAATDSTAPRLNGDFPTIKTCTQLERQDTWPAIKECERTSGVLLRFQRLPFSKIVQYSYNKLVHIPMEERTLVDLPYSFAPS